MKKTLSLLAFTMIIASHIFHGMWRYKDGHQINLNDVDLWTHIAKKLDEGGFEVLFIDVAGLYGNHWGSLEFHLEKGLQIPRNNSLSAFPVLAVNTKYLGISLATALIQESRFNFARGILTLDHMPKGRLA